MLLYVVSVLKTLPVNYTLKDLHNLYKYCPSTILMVLVHPSRLCCIQPMIMCNTFLYFYNFAGVEFGARMITIDGKQIKLQIWDTVSYF